MFPPEEPIKSIRGGYLYRLLRPEFVKTFPRALSSDAFSRFSVDPVSNNEVTQATQYLKLILIPKLAGRS